MKMKMFAYATFRLLAGLQIVSSLLCSPAAAIIFDELQSVNVWLTVSSLASKDPNDKANFLFRQIELNWINAPLNEDDYIALYLDSEPEQASGGPVSLHRPANMSGKFVLHDHHLPVIDFYAEQLGGNPNREPATRPRAEQRIDVASSRRSERRHESDRWHRHRSLMGPTWPGRRHDDERELEESPRQPEATRSAGLVEECVGYCVAYHSRRRILAKSCLRTQPNWMRDVKVGSRAITSIAIAGTHNSGTYLQQRPSANKIDKSVLQLINKYQLNQEENIFNQLVYGIRYLDLRVGYSKVKNRPEEELWIYHDIFRTDNSLKEVLEQVERFLELAPSEVVVMDFHRFTVGFQNENAQVERERHEMVLELLYKILGKFIVPSYLGQNAPISEYIGLNKRLFVGYAGRNRLMNQMHQQRLQLGPNLGSRGEQMLAHESSDKRREMDTSLDRMLFVSARNHTVQLAGLSNDDDDDQDEQETSDRRIGTRVYNKLKSLKLISRSFSKRSIEFNQANRSPELSKRVNVYKNRQRSPNSSAEQSLKVIQTPPPSGGGGGGGLSMMAEQSFHSKLSLLFNAVHHVWPNTDREDHLRQFIEQSTCRKYYGELNSIMAELTPTVFGAISDKYDGVRRLSSQTNRLVSDLIRSKFLHCINLIATDYFLGNDLIRLSIYANKMRQHLDKSLDLDSGGECKSFRRIEPLLRKSRESDSNQHQSSSVSSPSANFPSSLYQADGISDLFGSFFRRIFNL